jgi:uncharacterized protein (DUF1800 family)
MTIVSHEQKLQHLYWRAGFGPTIQQFQKASKVEEIVNRLIKGSEKLNTLKVPMPSLGIGQADMQNAEARRQIFQERRQALEKLNYTWLNQMATAEEQLQEKMTFFWHGHFACRLREPHLAQLQHNTLRKHALGKFPALLLAISKDPGMLQFLNNQQNRKQRPNENFAREVLELFTMGRGHYTEKDIKEAARAFTGWGFNLRGEFVFRERLHDNGKKTFMGRQGNFTGEDILQIIMENPHTATFITEKIYTFFVSDVPDAVRIRELSEYFFKSDYNIAGLLEKIFTSGWFYSPEVIGAKIKSPIELLVGLQRQFQITYADERSPLILQRVLGQELFHPPNVSGWAGGRNWIDSSTLAYRLRIGPALIQDAALEISLKPDDDAEPSKPFTSRKDGLRLARAIASLQGLQQILVKVDDKDLTVVLSNYLLQIPLKPEMLRMLQQNVDSIALRPDKIRAITLQLLSIPDYQVC